VDNRLCWDKSITFLIVQNINDVTKFYNIHTEQNQVPLVFGSFQLDLFFTLDYLVMCFVRNLSLCDLNLLFVSFKHVEELDHLSSIVVRYWLTLVGPSIFYKLVLVICVDHPLHCLCSLANFVPRLSC
jgi:hypothetical protein